MDLTPEQKAAYLASLQEAYYSGASSVRHPAGHSVEFRSEAVLKRLIDELKDELGIPRKGTRRVARYVSGL